MTPPGTRALAFASRWFDPAIVNRTFEPLVADWQREWIDASTARRPGIVARGLAAFACAAVVAGIRSLQSPTPLTIVGRVAIRLLVYMSLVALCIPTVVRPEIASAAMLLYLQSALSLALPYSMMVAVDAIRTDGEVPSHVERRAAIHMAIAGTLAMFALSDWSVARAALPALWVWTRWEAIDRQEAANRFARVPIVPMAIILADMIFFVDYGRDQALLHPPFGGLTVLIAMSFVWVPKHWWRFGRKAAS